jgi:hypothetical protein
MTKAYDTFLRIFASQTAHSQLAIHLFMQPSAQVIHLFNQLGEDAAWQLIDDAFCGEE